jgi:DNA topoisomerase II
VLKRPDTYVESLERTPLWLEVPVKQNIKPTIKTDILKKENLQNGNGEILKKETTTKEEKDEKSVGTIMVKSKKKVLDTRVHMIEKKLKHIPGLANIVHEMLNAPIRMVGKKFGYVPGLYNIINEIFVNSADHYQRDPTMNKITIDVDRKDGTISVWNNGAGIEVAIHKEHKKYLVELLFGDFLTSDNYDDDQARKAGGRNGYGAKLTNVFSQYFKVETNCVKTHQYYCQVWENNMNVMNKPIITKNKTASGWTRVTFRPDYARFDNMTNLDDDMMLILERRAYDLAGTLGQYAVKVYWNGTKIPVANFSQYVKLFVDSETKLLKSEMPDWEVIVTPYDFSTSSHHHDAWDQSQHVSFVNHIYTKLGGEHVKSVEDPIVKAIVDHLKPKFDQIKPALVKQHVRLFINASIVKPVFSNQSKYALTTKRQDFVNKWSLDDSFKKKVLHGAFMDTIKIALMEKDKKLLSKTDGKKRGRLDYAKLADAGFAGTRQSHKCTLILTEGDSAKQLAMHIRTKLGPDTYGVFPLRGKVLNVREAKASKVYENAEITAIKDIVGLKQNANYLDDITSLRYGRVMIMADQDHDGSHIKGLVINLFHFCWPSLLQRQDFLYEFITPIVKATHNKNKNNGHVFYTILQYQSWKKEEELKNPHAFDRTRGIWTIKYYKGLGTNTKQEVLQYCDKPKKHLLQFSYDASSDSELMHSAFHKKEADTRKKWLEELDLQDFLDQSIQPIQIKDFLKKELIFFWVASNTRAIPSAVDGFKPSLRKIMFAAFKKKLEHSEIKVSQFAGSVAELTSYHHNEMSLAGAIVGLAQNFIGSNNINFLQPLGQYGTRADHVSAESRYIFTKLEPITRLIFKPEDDGILTYKNDDGDMVEPEFYVPIIPVVLLNGAQGIGTGYSTLVHSYSPRDLIEAMRCLLHEKPVSHLKPWYFGFKGTITALATEGKISGYKLKCPFEETHTGIKITEIPLDTTLDKYELDYLTKYRREDKIVDFKDYSTDLQVHYNVIMTAEQLEEAKKGPGGILKYFGLSQTLRLTNMVLHKRDGKLHRYSTVQEILDDYYVIRCEYYEKRLAHLREESKKTLSKLSNKVRFILEAISEEQFTLRRVPKKELETKLDELKFDRIDGSYNYLLDLPLSSITKEQVEKLLGQEEKEKEHAKFLAESTVKSTWLKELDDLEEALLEYETSRLESLQDDAIRKDKTTDDGKKKFTSRKRKPSPKSTSSTKKLKAIKEK